MNESIIGSGQQQDVETAKSGVVLEKMYGDFFGSVENCQWFADSIPQDFFETENPVIVDAGGSRGVLGKSIQQRCENQGGDAQLVLVDTNFDALQDSEVKGRINADLLQSPLANESADLVVVRSVLQYVDPEKQKMILEELKRILKEGAMLVNQFVSYQNQVQADAVNKIFSYADRGVYFCGKEEGIDLHEGVFGAVEQVQAGPTLLETFDEFFVDRIHASDEQMAAAKEYVQNHIAELGNALTSASDPYAWQVPYTIVRCRK